MAGGKQYDKFYKQINIETQSKWINSARFCILAGDAFYMNWIDWFSSEHCKSHSEYSEYAWN